MVTLYSCRVTTDLQTNAICKMLLRKSTIPYHFEGPKNIELILGDIF